MPRRQSLRIILVALVPVLLFPLYGQTSCESPCPAPPNSCQRYTWHLSTDECILTDISGATCDYQGGPGTCSDGQCVPAECAGVSSYGICDEPEGGGSVGACIEDVCVAAAPEDPCVKVGVGRINCCSDAGCAVASGAYCNDPLDGVSCDPTGIEPVGQEGQDGVCIAGTCVATTGLCAGLLCPTTASDPCARDYCNPETGQCEEWIVDTFTECLVAGAPGLCLGGTCEQIGGGECNGMPCEASNSCQVAACRLPCLHSPGGCTPEELSNPSYVCEIDTLPNGAPCIGEPGQCTFGNCAFGGCTDDKQCEDGNPCTKNYCDPLGRLCDTSGAEALANGTPCAENEQGQVLAVCENGVCLPDLCINRDCSDGDLCTQDVCESPWGICSNPTADDGTICENNGQCVNGVCQPIITSECDHEPNDPDREFPVECGDGNECTYDRCDFFDQCTNPRKPNGTSCNNGNGQCVFGNCAITGF